MDDFVGGVFSNEVEGGRAGAKLTIRDGYLYAHLSELAVQGTTSVLRVNLRDCTIDLGGASGCMWFCRTQDRSLTTFSEAHGFGSALGEIPHLRLRVQHLQSKAQMHKRRSTVMLLAALLIAGLCAVGGYFALRRVSESAVMALPREADVKLGKLAAATMNMGGPTLHLPVIQEGVQTIVDRLKAADTSQFNYHVRIVDAPINNAFALPGGELVVYTGLIRMASSAEEVAAVLAHEMGHVVHRDGLQRIAQSVGLIAAVQLLVGDMGGLATVGTELLQQGALLSYGREQESNADHFAVELLHRAQLDPLALSSFFSTLAKSTEPLPDELAWLSTHPDLSQRISSIIASAQSQGAPSPIPLDLDFIHMQKSVGGATTIPSKPNNTTSTSQQTTETSVPRQNEESANKDDTHGN